MDPLQQIKRILLELLAQSITSTSIQTVESWLDERLAGKLNTSERCTLFFARLIPSAERAFADGRRSPTGLRDTLTAIEGDVKSGGIVTGHDLLAVVKELLDIDTHFSLNIDPGRELPMSSGRRAPVQKLPRRQYQKVAARAARKMMAPVKRTTRGVRSGARTVVSEDRRSAHSRTRIFFATDRKPTDGSTVAFGGDRGNALTLGECYVSIPKKHKIGSLESPSFLGFEYRPNPDKHIILQTTLTLEEEEFLLRVKESVRKSLVQDAFIFIHGFNVSFADAARRTAQLAFDLNFVGAPILYSWPSKGNVSAYTADEATAEWSAPTFEAFLTLLATKVGARKIHVIAHSMGNRVACNALKSMSAKLKPRQRIYPRVHHLVLAAPDIDAGVFQQLAATLKKVASFVTLYASSRDKAIRLSNLVHDYRRAGEPPPPILSVPGVECIDASTAGEDWLFHSYFADNWPVLSDIHSLLSTDKSASERFGMTEVNIHNNSYYVLRS